MMLLKKITSFVIILLFFVFTTSSEVLAQEEKNPAGFLYSISFPENQAEGNNKYFDLLVKPNEKQEININVQNTSNEDITVLVNLNNATTNKRGVLEYGQSDIDDDKSLKYPFTSIASSNKEISLKKNESKDLAITLDIPPEEFSGIILGGIELTKKAPSNDTSNNIYQHIIAVLLKENDNEVKPQLQFNSISAVGYIENSTYNNTVMVNFSNISPVIIEDMVIEIQVNEKTNPNLVYQVNKEHMKMAPNSNITIPISMQNDTVHSGEYESVIKITNASGINEKWKENFEISDTTAKELNQQVAYYQNQAKSSFPILKLIIVLIVVLLGCIIFYTKFFKTKHSKKKP